MTEPKRPGGEKPEDDSMEAYWESVQRTKPARKRSSSDLVRVPTVVPYVKWAQIPEGADRSFLHVLPGAPADRDRVFREYSLGDWLHFQGGIVIDSTDADMWIKTGPLNSLVSRLRTLPLPVESKDMTLPWFPHLPGVWELLWGLIAVENFVIEEPLRGLIDQPFYLVHDVHRALWEARFLAREHESHVPVEVFVETFLRWVLNEPLTVSDRAALSQIGVRRVVGTEQEQLDVFLFLLTLAGQNGLLNRAVLYFDKLERALDGAGRPILRQLHTLVLTGERWTKLGNCPLGVIVGFSAQTRDRTQLRRLHAKLATEIEVGICRAYE